MGLKPTKVFETYWRFAAERQRIFFKKLKQEPAPWTSDVILSKYKFTNAYRAADRVSQYLIRNVIYRGEQCPEEVFFRVILFRTFNRISTWKLLEETFGGISYKGYSFEHYDKVLTEAQNTGNRIYSAAYIMPSGNKSFGYSRKHRNHLKLLEKMLAEHVPSRMGESKSMNDAFCVLRSYPTIGDFLAYQYVTDINYSELTDFSEMEFVAAGPGAKSGIEKCFRSLGGLSYADVIRLVAERQEEEFKCRNLEFPDLWGRALQLIDCQNLFCEVDKYARLAHPEIKGRVGRKRIKQKYLPSAEPVKYWFPPKWDLNKIIQGD